MHAFINDDWFLFLKMKRVKCYEPAYHPARQYDREVRTSKHSSVNRADRENSCNHQIFWIRSVPSKAGNNGGKNF